MSLIIVPDDLSLPTITFDVCLSESHTGETTPADSPIEKGSVITDHLVNKPQEFECVATISNTPMPTNADGDGGRQTVQTGPGTIVVGYSNKVDRIARTWERLEAMRVNGKTCTVLTTLQEYANAALTRVSAPIQRDTYVDFTLNFRILEIVSSKRVAAPKPKEPKGQPETDKGAQSTTDGSSFLTGTNQSALKNLSNSAGKLLGNLGL